MTIPQSHYEQRLARIHAEQLVWRKAAGTVGLLRGLTFLAGTIIVWAALAWGFPLWSVFLGGGLLFARFLQLVAQDESYRQRLQQSDLLVAIQQEQLARIARRWPDIPAISAEIPAGTEEQRGNWRALSRDLDLLGPASLYQWICRAHTPRGREILRDWLFFSADPATVEHRGVAAAVLAPETDFREQLDLRGRQLAGSESGPREFVRWAEGTAWFASRRWLLQMARILPLILVTSASAALLGWLVPTAAFVIIVGTMVVGLVLSVIYIGPVHDIFNRVNSRQNEVEQYLELIDLVERLPVTSTHLAQIRHTLAPEPVHPDRLPARTALANLKRIVRLSQLRHSSLFGLVHLLVQVTTLIDFHVLDLLERWQLRHGRSVGSWFDAIGELEALASIASLIHDQPDWAKPEVMETATGFQASELGHPLLPDAVRNDVTLGPAGKLLLVTGSNMSGKSTLLRAIGTNVVLAQMGAPVCASRCSLPPVHLATSMRIEDSLLRGVSFFMAELQRLKQIVDQARQHHLSSPSENRKFQLLFLLDEILQGTNSRERNIAVSRVLKHLVDSKAWGAVTTHDLELANNPDLMPVCDLVHFRESIDSVQGKMTFDYRMRPGIATTTNAIRLLELVGLGS